MAERDAVTRKPASAIAHDVVSTCGRLQVVRASAPHTGHDPSIIVVRIDDFAAAVAVRARPELGDIALRATSR
jgi:hypothetical protein